jgi:hypothetical protein
VNGYHMEGSSDHPEGPDKVTGEGGGGEWEPIKILDENLANVSN